MPMNCDPDDWDLRTHQLVGERFRVCLDSQMWRGVRGTTGPVPTAHNTECHHAENLTDTDVSETGWTSVLPRQLIEVMWQGEDNEEMRKHPNLGRVYFCATCCGKKRR
jgi:hypothetical protein